MRFGNQSIRKKRIGEAVALQYGVACFSVALLSFWRETLSCSVSHFVAPKTLSIIILPILIISVTWLGWLALLTRELCLLQLKSLVF